MRPVLAVLLLALAAGPAMAQAPAAAPVVVYVISYRTGPSWKPGKPMAEQAIGPHGAYMRRLFDEGRMLAAGPTLDIDGGVVLLRAASLDEAQAVMAADPAVTSGLFVGEVRAWRPAFSSGEPVAPRRP